MWRVNTPNPPGKIIANSLTLNGLAAEYEPSTSVLSTTLHSRVSIDNLPPLVDVVPTASATYLGRSFMLINGSSRVVYQCLVNSAGSYLWVGQ